MRLRHIPSADTTWRDVLVICRTAAPGTPLGQALDPAAAWSDTNYLLAQVVDRLGILASERRYERPPAPVTLPGELVQPSPMASVQKLSDEAILARFAEIQKELG
jgi:hypothetical protein